MKRLGFIGTGGISGAHLGYLKTRKDVEIAALCDVKPESVQKRQQEFGGRAYSDFNVMLKQEKLDAIWICTPPQVRREPLLACADHGVPVFCEKPVERDLATARAIAADLKKRNARVQIGYVFRSIPLVDRIRKEIADDRIHLLQSFYGCNVSLANSLPPWFYDKELSGGALVDQATHNLDLLRMLFGEVVSVKGVAANPVRRKEKGYTIEEVISLSFLFANGAAGSHIHTWVGDTWRNEIFVSGEKRLYRINLGRGTLTVEEGAETRTFQQDLTGIFGHENDRFLGMVESGDWSRNPSDYADGAQTLALTVASDEAVMSGAGVQVPMVKG